MSRRKQANRAEAIVRGVGGILLILILGIMVYAMPHILKGTNTDEMLHTMLHTLIGFALLVGAVVVTGLIVWVKILKGKKKPQDLE